MLDNKVKLVEANIQAAYDHLVEIEEAMGLLEAAGMHPAIPHFQWQDRSSDGRYLYLIFRQNSDGSYQGPDGKKKVYIGNKPEAILEARRLTDNRQKWESLQAQRRELTSWLTICKSKLLQLQRQADDLLKYSQEFPRAKVSKIAA